MTAHPRIAINCYTAIRRSCAGSCDEMPKTLTEPESKAKKMPRRVEARDVLQHVSSQQISETEKREKNANGTSDLNIAKLP